MKSYFSRLLLLAFFLLLTCCAFGQKTDYKGYSNFEIEYKMPPISFGVIDKRPYVLDHSKALSYSGTQRSLAGIPYDVHTASGHPLSEDLGGLLTRTLERDGIDVNQILLSSEMSEKEAVMKLASEGRKSLMLMLNDWKTHVYFNPILEYDLKLFAISETGKIISDINKRGTIAFGSNQNTKNLAEAVKNIYYDLFNNPKIKTALLTGTGHEMPQVSNEVNQDEQLPEKIPTAKPSCTVEQILKMKEMGMSDSQIKAACE